MDVCKSRAAQKMRTFHVWVKGPLHISEHTGFSELGFRVSGLGSRVVVSS